MPEEIASCEPHLFRQIELIEPKLVATLGNFATKLLSGKPAGITRVHGYEQEVTLGARTVTLFPLYHPAAALYTPSMLKVLEEDFARIPALLERASEEPVPVEDDAAAGGRARSRIGSARPVLTVRTRARQRFGGRDRGDRGAAGRAPRSRRRRHRSPASWARGRRRSSGARAGSSA